MPWPQEMFVQCGDSGVVFSKSGSYETAFFEAFPEDTFLRGEGKTLEEAERACWARYEKVRDCKGHEFERRGRKDGYGWCKHCGMGAKAFEPLTVCSVCGVPTNFSTDKNDQLHCESCSETVPLSEWRAWKYSYACFKITDEVVALLNPETEEQQERYSLLFSEFAAEFAHDSSRDHERTLDPGKLAERTGARFGLS